ncbi:hypothetical protein [Legionella qingyii]|nr:hypothetical protein [Legionella qingyii]
MKLYPEHWYWVCGEVIAPNSTAHAQPEKQCSGSSCTYSYWGALLS